MSEYWISQARKFCDYCKCWITDNKPSVEFHEKGKRHQENVKLKIKELRKKGFTDAKKKEEMDESMRAMEEAALAALKRDLTSDPSMAAQYGIEVKPGTVFVDSKKNQEPNSKKNQVASTSKSSEPSQTRDGTETKPAAAAAEKPFEIIEWFEAKSEEGYTYYWNISTGASVWVKPEKYLSIEQQKKQNETAKDSTIESSVQVENKVEVDEEPAGPVATCAVKPERPGAYGSWSTIKEEEQVDLQLPVSQSAEAECNIIIPQEPKIKFREKKVNSLNSGTGEGFFKKRKINSGAAKSIRKRDS